MDAMLRPRRLYVCGGSALTDQAAALWGEIGRQLAEEDGLVVITGGLWSQPDSPERISSDKAMADGFEAGLQAQGIDPAERIETCHPDPALDPPGLRRFSKGRLRILKYHNRQARRFRMVFDADVVASIEGSPGTHSILDVALAIERPVFPVPCGGEASEAVWKTERAEICKTFSLSPDEIQTLEKTKLGSLGPDEIRVLARAVRTCLMRGFTRQCFVIMPFDKSFDWVFDRAITPALRRFGLKPVRTDRNIATGNLVEAIRFGIQHCYIAIADTSGDRANVMYELGIAHAQAKQVILLRRTGPTGNELPPFDLLTESVIFYDENDLNTLQERIEGAIETITGRKAGPEK
jgi:predicted Rossmann-fold nucleotide-binding protein